MAATVIPPSVYEPIALGAVKAAAKKAGATTGTVYMVPIDQIAVAEDFNIRVTGNHYNGRVNALSDLIERNGFFISKPITCLVDGENDFYVVDGHRRLEAARRVNERVEKGKATCPVIEHIPVIVRPNGTTMEDLTYGLMLENTGEPLTPLEVGIAIARLQAYGQDPKAIAGKLGMTVKYVNDLLTLNAAVPGIRALVAGGKVAAKTAIEAILEHKTDALKVLLGAVGVAEASGRAKATPKHVKAVAGEPRPKATRKAKTPEASVGEEIRPPDSPAPGQAWNLSAGDVVSLESIKPIARIYGADWWELVPDREGQVRIVSSIQVTVSRSPSTTDPVIETPQPQSRRRRAAPIVVPAPEPVFEEEEV